MTQGEVARRADVSPQVVSRLLAEGNADITLSIACRLAWAMGKGVSDFEDAVFEEWKMQPKTLEIIDREMTRGRLQQKLNAKRNHIAAYEAMLPNCSDDAVGRVTRRWIEGMIRHWRDQEQKLKERLQQLDSENEERQDKVVPE